MTAVAMVRGVAAGLCPVALSAFLNNTLATAARKIFKILYRSTE